MFSIGSPGKNGPHPLLFPLPRGAGGEDHTQNPDRSGLNYVARRGGLTYAINFSYEALAPRFLGLLIRALGRLPVTGPACECNPQVPLAKAGAARIPPP